MVDGFPKSFVVFSFLRMGSLMENYVFDQFFRQILQESVDCQVSFWTVTSPFCLHLSEKNLVDCARALSEIDKQT